MSKYHFVMLHTGSCSGLRVGEITKKAQTQRRCVEAFGAGYYGIISRCPNARQAH